VASSRRRRKNQRAGLVERGAVEGDDDAGEDKGSGGGKVMRRKM
jgi:hypothetical protein